jgi:hypothetical protein
MLPINDPRFGEAFRVLFGQKAQQQLSQLPDVMPVIAIGGGPEEAFLRGEELLMVGRSIGPVAGQFSQHAIECSVGSSFMVVLEQLDVVFNSAYLSLLPAVTIGSGGSNVFPRDSRIQNQLGTWSQCAITSGTNAIALSATSSLICSAGARVASPIIIAPGARLVVESTAVNLQLGVNYYWREVPLPPR